MKQKPSHLFCIDPHRLLTGIMTFHFQQQQQQINQNMIGNQTTSNLMNPAAQQQLHVTGQQQAPQQQNQFMSQQVSVRHVEWLEVINLEWTAGNKLDFLTNSTFVCLHHVALFLPFLYTFSCKPTRKCLTSKCNQLKRSPAFAVVAPTRRLSPATGRTNIAPMSASLRTVVMFSAAGFIHSRPDRTLLFKVFAQIILYFELNIMNLD